MSTNILQPKLLVYNSNRPGGVRKVLIPLSPCKQNLCSLLSSKHQSWSSYFVKTADREELTIAVRSFCDPERSRSGNLEQGCRSSRALTSEAALGLDAKPKLDTFKDLQQNHAASKEHCFSRRCQQGFSASWKPWDRLDFTTRYLWAMERLPIRHTGASIAFSPPSTLLPLRRSRCCPGPGKTGARK